MDLTQDEITMAELIRKELGEDFVFKPFVLYNNELDCIRVQTMDCSVTEVSVGTLLNLLEQNYPENDETTYVGFNMECARSFCRERGLSDCGKVSVIKILGSLAETDHVARQAILNIALPILKEHGLDEVEFPPT